MCDRTFDGDIGDMVFFWLWLRSYRKINVLLSEFRRAWGEYQQHSKSQRHYSFLGHSLCARAWRRLLRVDPTLAVKQWRL